MSTRLTEKAVAALPAPKAGNRIVYDAPDSNGKGWTPGFGCRVTAAHARSFILTYRTKAGRSRRMTIGAWPAWSLNAARVEAATLKRKIDGGADPLGELRDIRAADNVTQLCDRFIAEHLPKKRASTVEGYQALIAKYIKPQLGALKVADVGYADVDRLHRKVTAAGMPYAANRCLAVLSKMFALAVRWQMRADNPCRGIERNQEQKRKRYLSAEELARLTAALAEHDDQQAANVIRLLLLTGARKTEALAARWEQFDLAAGLWVKPGSTTKQKTEHRVPLSAPTRQLLAGLRKVAAADAEFVFPGRWSGHRVNIKDDWAALCKSAKIKGARIHDLRHSFASHLASAGVGLHIIGGLLGHTQPSTTHRYAHLLDDPLRAATERVGALLSGQPIADVVPIKGQPLMPDDNAIHMTLEEFAQAHLAVEQALEFKNFAPLIERLRTAATLLTLERNVAADILEGKLKKPRHRMAQPPGVLQFKLLRLALAVRVLMDKNISRKAAVADVTKARGVKASTVQKACKAYPDLVPSK